MPRRFYKKRTVKPERLYQSYETAKLINYLMRNGEKSVAERLVYSVFESLKRQKLNPLEVLHKAVANAAPHYEVRPKRVGGASYLVPAETRPTRKVFLSLNWMIESAAKRSSKEYKSFDKKLLAEIIDAAQGAGEAVDRRRRVEKLAEANKAFAHFKW